MRNKIAAFTRKSVSYHPEFRKLSLVKSVTSALLLQQLDFWFERYESFWKFTAPARNHELYKEGDSWIEELGFSKDEFRTAFANIGVVHKSKSAFMNAEEMFMRDGQEYYYASYIDRRHNLTYYVRNDSLLDRELDALCLASAKENNVRTVRPVPGEEAEVATEAADVIVDTVIIPVVSEPPKSTKKRSKRSSEEIATEKAKKEQEKAERIEQENLKRYEFFGSKERYLAFNAWYWGFYTKKSFRLDNPGLFYNLALTNLLAGGEKYRYLLSEFEVAEQQHAQRAKVAQEQERVSSAEETTRDQIIAMYSAEEMQALDAAGLTSERYEFMLRQMQNQTHDMRMRCIETERERQIMLNARNKRVVADQENRQG